MFYSPSKETNKKAKDKKHLSPFKKTKSAVLKQYIQVKKFYAGLLFAACTVYRQIIFNDLILYHKNGSGNEQYARDN